MHLNILEKKYFQLYLENTDGFIVIRHFNSYTDDIKKLRLLCSVSNFKMLKYKNGLVRSCFFNKKLSFIFSGTFFFIFFKNKSISALKAFLVEFRQNKFNFLSELVFFNNQSYSFLQFEKLINNFSNFTINNLFFKLNSFKLFQFLVLKRLVTFFLLKNANN